MRHSSLSNYDILRDILGEHQFCCHSPTAGRIIGITSLWCEVFQSEQFKRAMLSLSCLLSLYHPYIPHFYFPCVILSYGCVSVCMHVCVLCTVHSAQEKIDALKVLGADVRPVPAVPFDNPDNYNRQMVRRRYIH